METRRLLEMIGSFLLGGGCVAAAYELAGHLGADEGEAMQASTDEAGDAALAASDSTLAVAKSAALHPDPAFRPDEEGHYSSFPQVHEPPPTFDEQAEAAFPQHGLVTGIAVIVRERPQLEAQIAGIVRAGTKLRVDAERTFGGECRQGWRHIYPDGWICHDAGLAVGESPPTAAVVSIPAPDLDADLPFEYWRVKDEVTPFFHRLPSFGEQDQADAAGQRWFQRHQRNPMPLDAKRRPSDVPAVVKEFMNAGYWVTKAGEEVKSQRRFIRTLRGAYARKYQFHQRESSTFRGTLVGPDDLPKYFIRRELSLVAREGEGSDVLKETGEIPKRLMLYPFVRKVVLGNKEYYEDEKGQLMRAYAVGKAYRLKRPPGVGADEHWVHVDLSEQTLVAYEGDDPVFITLVSTGREPGMTPPGVYRVQSKYISTSMRDQPPEDEAYSIEDVPWTQYFHTNVALHGAFWHSGFGLVRSHGCVNLSPADARWLFGFTRPLVPEGWHAVSASTLDAGKGSPVVVTE